MLLSHVALLWMLHIGAVQSQLFPFQDLFKPFVNIPNLFNRQQPKTTEDLIAESRLKKCCNHLQQADAQCKAQYCSFDALSADKALLFMTTCGPRGPTVGQMWDCASSRKDHSKCCRMVGVGPECMAYCQTTNGVPSDPAIYMNCLKYFDAVKLCFKQYLSKNPNLYGDL
ncbi:unnamed protein product [Gongylonema pulchrum]|uniref:DB domain-containing protein n=1 Tax=Gongylonema pulchrum TaxID=637853 RepID=A0A183D321_9BILA|nr:unnamed protein product [Gongylonema pulchrum]